LFFGEASEISPNSAATVRDESAGHPPLRQADEV
jgi:hypothetical protein